MKTYEIQFTGRRLGAIGKFYSIRAQVFAENDEAARMALYDRFEHITLEGKAKEIQSPFDENGLIECVQNDKTEFNAFRRMVSNLRQAIDRNAWAMQRVNADWHDDPDAPDHALYHAPAEQQFTRAMRDAAVLELVSRHLDVLNENETANAVNA